MYDLLLRWHIKWTVKSLRECRWMKRQPDEEDLFNLAVFEDIGMSVKWPLDIKIVNGKFCKPLAKPYEFHYGELQVQVTKDEACYFCSDKCLY